MPLGLGMCNMTGKRTWRRAIFLAAAALLLLHGFAAAFGMDGQFDDWAGQPYVPDPVGDGASNNTDMTAFYWGSTPGVSMFYFMFERTEANGPAYFFVRLDMNMNGSFTDNVDRLVQVYYKPFQDYSEVSTTILTGDGATVSGYGGDWGEGMREGARRVETYVSFADLGIDVGQTVDMVAAVGQSGNLGNADYTPDGGTITWSPIPALGWPLLAGIVVVFIGMTWYERGRFAWQGRSS